MLQSYHSCLAATAVPQRATRAVLVVGRRCTNGGEDRSTVLLDREVAQGDYADGGVAFAHGHAAERVVPHQSDDLLNSVRWRHRHEDVGTDLVEGYGTRGLAVGDCSDHDVAVGDDPGDLSVALDEDIADIEF